jgi:hypothetical protein
MVENVKSPLPYLTQNDPVLAFAMNVKSQFSQFSNTTIDHALSNTKHIEASDNQKSISGCVILLPHHALLIQLIRQNLNGRIVESI